MGLGIASAVACGSASAADMALKAQRSIFTPEPIITWSGFYVGLNGGLGWGSTEHIATINAGASSGSFDVDGGLIGGTFGYNRQFGQFVLGFETDVDAAWIKGNTTRGIAAGNVNVAGFGIGFPGIPLYLGSELNWLDTVRVRVGFDPASWLFYVTGGLAYGNVTSTFSTSLFGISASAAQSDSRLGWTIGAGAEYKFSPNLSGKVEYLYVDLGKNSQMLIDQVNFTTSILRVGVNYRLGDLLQ
jgi:outer membrane immunogenic protein